MTSIAPDPGCSGPKRFTFAEPKKAMLKVLQSVQPHTLDTWFTYTAIAGVSFIVGWIVAIEYIKHKIMCGIAI